MISFFCPFCKHVLKAPEEWAGQSMPCEQCKLEIRVPQPAAPPPLLELPSTQRTTPSWWKRVLRRDNAHAST
jgi:hypothetical protein